MSEGPNADAYAAVRSAQKSVLSRNARNYIPVSESPNAGAAPVGAPGSAMQEQGWQPATTRVPIRQTPQYDLTPQSVPGPDTSGKGNLLTPLAKRGDPRAAAELQRRGRTVIYLPDSDTPLYMDSAAFANLLKNLQK
jgi:hypothetical protein